MVCRSIGYTLTVAAYGNAIEQWEQQLDSTYGALKQMFPRQRAFIESFFPKPAKKAEKAEAAPV